MNLIQVADRLKELPNSPQTMQALTAYANGASPIVPPYLALTELQRRTRMAQEAAAGQPPAGTVKDQIEQQASGIGALAQQGQAMAQMQPQQAQQMEQPVQAAGGGLLSLLARAAQARRMNSGGIIAFSKAGSVDDSVDDEDDDATLEDDEDDTGGGDEPVVTARGGAGESGGIEDLIRVQTRKPGEAGGLMSSREMLEEARRIYAERQAQRPAGQTYLEERKALLEKNPELAAALADRTGEQLSRFDEIQALRRAEFEKQRQEAAAAKPGILQLLGQAAMGSRGQYGKSALATILGGYGQLQNRADALALEQEQALRMKEIDLQQTRMDMLGKIDEIKRARAEGDVNKEMQSTKELAQLKSKYDTASAQMLGRGMSAVGRVAGAETSAASREAAARTRADAERFKAQESTRRAAATAAEATRRALSPKGREAFANRVAELRAAGKDEEADRLIDSYNKLSGTSAGVGAINAQRNALKLESDLIRKQLEGGGLKPDEKAAKQKRLDEIATQLQTLQPAKPAPAASEEAPKTPPISSLKEGYNTTFGNGQVWTLQNGKPKQVK